MTPARIPSGAGTVAAKLKTAFPIADALDYGLEELAAMADLPVADVEEFTKQPGALAELDAAKVRAHADGSLLETKAIAIAYKCLDRILPQIDSMDAFDASEVLKMPLRILEAADRRRAAVRDSGEKLPLITFCINLGDDSPSISMGAKAQVPHIQDVEAKLIDDGEGSSWV